MHQRIVDAVWQLFGHAPDYEAQMDPGPPHRRREGPPPDTDDARVPTGPPKKPKPSSVIALPIPEPEETDVDAIGKALGG